MKRVRILRDTSGASIVIALVFFLICGIVGSVVMTAASVQGKAALRAEHAQRRRMWTCSRKSTRCSRRRS